jgi:protein-S-isoprenylcysteine O-methyltransferase Ste14
MAEHRVVESGPYALVRHPIYTGLIAAAAAMAAIRATPWALAGLALFALGFALKAKVEERFLESELGGYASYRARVPMIVPFFRRKPSPRIG